MLAGAFPFTVILLVIFKSPVRRVYLLISSAVPSAVFSSAVAVVTLGSLAAVAEFHEYPFSVTPSVTSSTVYVS